MKTIAIFGTSWSDPRYYEKSDEPRHRTWNEYIQDHTNASIDVYAASGSSLEYQMALLQSLIVQNKQYDLVIFEIAPLVRDWVLCDTNMTFSADFGFVHQMYYSNIESDINRNTPPEYPPNYRHWGKYDTNEYHLSGGAMVISDRKNDSSVQGHNTKEVNDFLNEKSIFSLDQTILKNLHLLNSLSLIFKQMSSNLITISFEKHGGLDRFPEIVHDLLPSNIGLGNILNNFREVYPYSEDSEWWVDQSHPSHKGNKWIFDNIFMNNQEFKNAILT
jgi:hypothetical protein